MNTIITTKWKGVTPEQYEKASEAINFRGNTPKGFIFHVAAFDNNGIQVTEMWESNEDFNNFLHQRLVPAAKAAGIIGEPQVEMLPVHTIFAPALERSR